MRSFALALLALLLTAGLVAASSTTKNLRIADRITVNCTEGWLDVTTVSPQQVFIRCRSLPAPSTTPAPTPLLTPTPEPPPPGGFFHDFRTQGMGPFAYDGQWGEQGLVYSSCRNGNGGSHHNAAQSAAMTSIQTDGLHLRLERYSGNEFKSAIISTNAAGLTFRGGRFEVRMKYPAGAGMWPAFWLLTTGNGPRDEIDVMEAYPNPAHWPFPQRYEVTTHRVVNGTDTRHAIFYGTDASPWLTDAWHTFGIEWRQGQIDGFLDGVKIGTLTQDIPWVPMYVLLDFKGGSFHQCLNSTTPNGDMVVEWVKVTALP